MYLCTCQLSPKLYLILKWYNICPKKTKSASNIMILLIQSVILNKIAENKIAENISLESVFIELRN
jgi:hypothetical protein